MSDNLKKKGPPDRTRINVNEKWEVDWWCEDLGCSEAQLRAAVQAVGVMVVNVKRYLGK